MKGKRRNNWVTKKKGRWCEKMSRHSSGELENEIKDQEKGKGKRIEEEGAYSWLAGKLNAESGETDGRSPRMMSSYVQ